VLQWTKWRYIHLYIIWSFVFFSRIPSASFFFVCVWGDHIFLSRVSHIISAGYYIEYYNTSVSRKRRFGNIVSVLTNNNIKPVGDNHTWIQSVQQCENKKKSEKQKKSVLWDAWYPMVFLIYIVCYAHKYIFPCCTTISCTQQPIELVFFFP